MKIKHLFFLLFLFSLFAITNSCKKEGCTDTSAENYDPKADINDGSCVY